jgi:hypothetical protein
MRKQNIVPLNSPATPAEERNKEVPFSFQELLEKLSRNHLIQQKIQETKEEKLDKQK